MGLSTCSTRSQIAYRLLCRGVFMLVFARHHYYLLKGVGVRPTNDNYYICFIMLLKSK